MPSAAWLEFSVEPADRPEDGCLLLQRALFHPRGLVGHAYWWSVAPFHGVVFDGMLRNLQAAAERDAAGVRS